jgi:hypothetical protein
MISLLINLRIIFFMLYSLNECHLTEDAHIMVLPSYSQPGYSLYHHYKNSRYLFLINHNEILPDTLYHQYQIDYPMFSLDTLHSKYCVIDSSWEQVYIPTVREEPLK